MPDNEKTYIGNIVLDVHDEERLRKWLNEIIDSRQGHGKGFDADTVDGFHASDFATAFQGQLAETSLQEGLTIGSTLLKNTSDVQYIKTDGVRLNEELITFFNGLNDESDLIDFLRQMFYDYTAKIGEIDDKKVDKDGDKVLSTYDYDQEAKDIVDGMKDYFEMYQCPAGEPGVTAQKKLLNAGAVNHLQFILTTDEIYETYSDDIKNAWNNIFIFIDEEDYPSEYESPLDCPIETGYEFRIDTSRPNEVWLQYKGRLAVRWLDLIKINSLYDQFLEYGDFENIMTEISTAIVDAKIAEKVNSVQINNILKQINPPQADNYEDYPFWTRNLNFIYDVTRNGSSLASVGNDGLARVDLTSLTTPLENEISSLKNRVSQAENNITTNKNNIASNTSRLNSQTNELAAINSSINNLESGVNNLNQAIRSLQNQLNDAKLFLPYLVIGVSRYDRKKAMNFVSGINQEEDVLGAYDPDGSGKYSLRVTNAGQKLKDPDKIYVRIIQEHTGRDPAIHTNTQVYFFINGVGYSRTIVAGTDYAQLNISLEPGSYNITAMYRFTDQTYETPIYANSLLIVEDKY